jgi:hypothetical protein
MARGAETVAAWPLRRLGLARPRMLAEAMFDCNAFEQLRNHSSHLVFLLEGNS